ncbi:MAG TPA: hypothetical protein VFE57_08000 [Cyclobacteriaceae bacterium]|jgi:hypothetical protein|nr:hypothetical protein [Cyclobacteriaceae bacterium]
MKKPLLIVLMIFGLYSSYAKDILALTDHKLFEGKITKIEKCYVHFKSDSGTFLIPAEDIFYIQFENPSDKVLNKYLKLQQTTEVGNCLKGAADATMYHGKAAGHVVLGVLFGPFAVIGAALARPTPMRGKSTMAMSENKELFDDPEYLQCYKKKAKGQNVGHAAIGWAVWMIIVLII